VLIADRWLGSTELSNLGRVVHPPLGDQRAPYVSGPQGRPVQPRIIPADRVTRDGDDAVVFSYRHEDIPVCRYAGEEPTPDLSRQADLPATACPAATMK
jgi:hypothetical protein